MRWRSYYCEVYLGNGGTVCSKDRGEVFSEGFHYGTDCDGGCESAG